jgi:hypothetical protein
MGARKEGGRERREKLNKASPAPPRPSPHNAWCQWTTSPPGIRYTPTRHGEDDDNNNDDNIGGQWRWWRRLAAGCDRSWVGEGSARRAAADDGGVTCEVDEWQRRRNQNEMNYDHADVVVDVSSPCFS